MRTAPLGPIFVVLLLLSLAGGTLGGGLQAAEVSLKIASANVTGSLEDKYNAYFTEQVNKRNAGMKIQHIAGTALGNAPQTMDQVVNGSIAMMGNEMAWVAPFDKDLDILNWGFTFRDMEHMSRFFENTLFAEMLDRVRLNHGLRVLSAVPAQPRYTFATKPFKNIDEVKGLKIRVPQIRTWVELWKAFGASPTPLTFGEVFLAMKTGVVDAAGGPPSAAYANSFHKAGKYVMNTLHPMSTCMLVINEKHYQALTPQQQAVLKEEAKNTLVWAKQTAQTDSDENLRKMVAEGAELVGVEMEGFRKAAGEAGRKLEEEGLWSKGLFDRIQSIK